MLKSILLLLAIASISRAAGPKTYIYKTVGDLQIDLDVYVPAASPPSTGFPVFFTMHGGGYIEGSKSSSFNKQERDEALSRGWVIISINYRLLPGVFLDEILEDVQDAYKWVHTELVKLVPLNLDLITVFGKSAGGGLAVLGGYKLSPRPAVVVGFYSGLSNWTDPSVYNPNTPVNPLLVSAANQLSVPVLTHYTAASKDDPRKALAYAAQATGKAGWLAVTRDLKAPVEQVMAKLRDLSATENVDKDYPPTYLAHGLIDKVVPYEQSVQLGNKLKENNIPYVLDLVPNVGHSFDSSPDMWEQHVLPAFEFAQKYMQVGTVKKTNFLEKLLIA